MNTSCRPPRPPAAGRGVSFAGPSAPALRLPARCTGLSTALVGGSGSLSGSSSGSLPAARVSDGIHAPQGGARRCRTQELVEVLQCTCHPSAVLCSHVSERWRRSHSQFPCHAPGGHGSAAHIPCLQSDYPWLYWSRAELTHRRCCYRCRGLWVESKNRPSLPGVRARKGLWPESSGQRLQSWHSHAPRGAARNHYTVKLIDRRQNSGERRAHGNAERRTARPRTSHHGFFLLWIWPHIHNIYIIDMSLLIKNFWRALQRWGCVCFKTPR